MSAQRAPFRAQGLPLDSPLVGSSPRPMTPASVHILYTGELIKDTGGEVGWRGRAEMEGLEATACRKERLSSAALQAQWQPGVCPEPQTSHGGPLPAH